VLFSPPTTFTLSRTVSAGFASFQVLLQCIRGTRLTSAGSNFSTRCPDQFKRRTCFIACRLAWLLYFALSAAWPMRVE